MDGVLEKTPTVFSRMYTCGSFSRLWEHADFESVLTPPFDSLILSRLSGSRVLFHGRTEVFILVLGPSEDMGRAGSGGKISCSAYSVLSN